ncbi:MAG: hypothetical protein RI564_07130 [Gracilimonas sp.]|nr:hypothetical protein [Gracilimonas sp.]
MRLLNQLSFLRISLLLSVLTLGAVFPLAAQGDQENPKEQSKYLEAVLTFADNVLQEGRDSYGKTQSPLFVDGIHATTKKTGDLET